MLLACLAVLCLPVLTGCSTENTNVTATEEITPTVTRDVTYEDFVLTYDDDDLDDSQSGTLTKILLSDSGTTVEGDGATVDGDTVTITSAGIYDLSGTLSQGQIIVDTQDEGVVRLLLDGADITCDTGTAIWVKNADKAVLTLASGTENTLNGGSATPEDTTVDAVVFSTDDLTVNGSGSLAITAAAGHGIACKDTLKIVSGTLTVDATGDALRGKDAVAIDGGTLNLTAGGDGIQAYNEEESDQGNVVVTGASLTITAEGDGIQAYTAIRIEEGTVNIVSGGGYKEAAGNQSADAPSTRALKAGIDILISGGTLTLDAADDGIHSDYSFTMQGGDVTITGGDDGIHADATLEINDGTVRVEQSYEGLESAALAINGGNISIVSDDDGINAAGGQDSSDQMGPGGQDNFSEDSDHFVYINGGYLVLDATGDGIDANGSVYMTGGTVIVNGPTADNNGALDFSEFIISGGVLIAAGSAGMAQVPDESSTQNSLMITYADTQAAGTLVRVQDESGEGVITFAPLKEYRSVVISSPDLQNNVSYTVLSGGTATGTETDGLYANDGYSGGSEITDFSISSTVTSVAEDGAQAGGGMNGSNTNRTRR